MRDFRPKTYWNEAALRAQGESVRAAWAEEDPQEKKPIRREPPPRPPEPAPLVHTDDELQLRLAEELDYARRLLDAMGDELSGDVAVVMRHGTALQSVDILGQMLGHIAAVIRCSEPQAAVEKIGMAELKARLMRRSAL